MTFENAIRDAIARDATWARHHAESVGQRALLLLDRPNFELHAEEEIDRAISEIDTARRRLIEARERINRLPVEHMQAAE